MADSKENKLMKDRAANRDNQAKEIMRDKISFTKTLTSIDEAEEVLLGLIRQEEEPSNARIGAIKALLDSKWRKMNKQLPDLKAIELSGADGKDLVPATIQIIHE